MSVKNNKFFEKVLNEVKKIPVSDVIAKYVKVRKNKYGDHDALCPFHGDSHFGNFKINDTKKIFKCFTCDAYGDGIEFVKELFHLDFKKAVMKIAADQGIILKEQAEGFVGGNLTNIKVNVVHVNINENCSKPNGLIDKKSSFGLNWGYDMFLRHSTLSEEHRQYLREERGLSDEEINEKGFFTFPEPTDEFIEKLNKTCLEIGISTDIFKGVPGFHTSPDLMREHNGKKIHYYSFKKRRGIGIPQRNAEGEIIGIQIRNDVVNDDKSKRYTWFSSSYASYNDNKFIFGSAAGAPIHVAYPKENKYPNVVFITEGFFKAEAVAKEFKAICLSVSGVGNYREIPEVLNSVTHVTGHSFEHIYVAYDADMCQNVQVFNHAKNMATLIKENYRRANCDTKIYMTLWRESHGKGIDDLIQNGKSYTLRKVNFDLFARLYDGMIEQFIEKYNRIQQVPKGVISKTFYNQVFPKVYVA